jgi:hypothetical protein
MSDCHTGLPRSSLIAGFRGQPQLCTTLDADAAMSANLMVITRPER